MLKKLLVLAFCGWGYLLGLSAQQPAYFILGEHQFSGQKIFDIIQDKSGNYYFATNDGIVKYNFNQFEPLEIKEVKSVAFFNLRINKQGQIFFNNLNNQIFKLENNHCELFYELKAEESSQIIELTFDKDDNLVVGARQILVINKNKTVIARYGSNSTYNTLFHLDENTILFHKTFNEYVVLFKNGVFSEKRLQIKNNNPRRSNLLLQFYRFDNKIFALDIKTKSHFLFNDTTWTLTEIPHFNFFNSAINARFYATDKRLWSASPFKGINSMENQFSPSFETWYKDYFISDVYQDHEGNILLGTFENGVIVIPDTKIPDVIHPFDKNTATSLWVDKSKSLFLGTNSGEILSYQNNRPISISTDGNKPIEGIYGDDCSDYIVFDDGYVKAYHTKSKKTIPIFRFSLKDVAFVSKNVFYTGNNAGICKIAIGHNENPSLKYSKRINFRIYSIAYQPLNKKLYCATANGFFELDSNDQSQKITFKGKDIYSEKVVYGNSRVYVVTRENGILEIDQHSRIRQIIPEVNGKTEPVRNIKIYKDKLIAGSVNGLFMFDRFGRLLRQYHSIYGFGNKRIFNFIIDGDNIWVSHTGGVQKIDLIYNIPETVKPEIIIQKIIVNNIETDLNQNSRFSSTQRKFQFVLVSPTLRNHDNITYHYKLKGYDDQWQVQNAKNNVITFNALSPGDYTLVVKTEIFGRFSAEKTHSFTIAKPVFSQWWFYLTIVSLLLLVVYLIYRRQLNRQKLKSKQINELNLSKLTAIQSQMNPHFIFNSLNSIQDLVLQQNAGKAYDSIGKFALLIRKIMHHSEKEFIDIEEELSILNLYLEMELLRIKRDFIYTINSNGLSDIMIPPMLIQPFIENAIKHGLLHKKGEKKLNIEMYLKGDSFVCEITDNGIGRKKTQEIKERQHKLHESFSGHTLARRLEILKNQFGGNFGVETIDLYDNNLVATGTRVILSAPYKRKF